MGLSVSKAGARGKAIEQAMSVLAAMRVTVDPVQRRWKDQNYPDLVLTRAGDIRENLPPFFSPPVGTDDYRIEQDRMKSNKKPKPDGFKSFSGGSADVHHLGPPVSGKRMEHFVIMLRRNEDNPICVLNSSAQFCKMGVDFYFEKERGTRNDEEKFICTLFIEGHAVADGKGVKKTLKLAVADRALKCLSKICHTVVITDCGLTRGSIMYRKDIKNEGKYEEIKPKAVEETSVASKMMKMMGWKDGEGLGASSTGIVEPVKAIGSFNREGLGSKAIDSDNITREEATEMIENYATSDSIEELTFSSELNFDERLEIKMMAKRYGLSERTVMESNFGRKRAFLVLSKKIGPEVIIEQLEKEGKWGRYQLVRPQGGDRYVISKYLNYQDRRASQGTPPQILNQQSDVGMGRDFRSMGGFSNKPDGWNKNRFECGGDRFDGGPATSFGRGGGHAPFGRGGGLGRRGEQSFRREAGRVIRPLMSVGSTEPLFTVGSNTNNDSFNTGMTDDNIDQRQGTHGWNRQEGGGNDYCGMGGRMMDRLHARDGRGRYDGGSDYGGIGSRMMNMDGRGRFDCGNNPGGMGSRMIDQGYDMDGGNNYGGMGRRMMDQGYDMDGIGRYGGGDHEVKKYSGTGSGSRKLTSVRGRKVHH